MTFPTIIHLLLTTFHILVIGLLCAKKSPSSRVWPQALLIDGRFIYENIRICRARIGFLPGIIKNKKRHSFLNVPAARTCYVANNVLLVGKFHSLFVPINILTLCYYFGHDFTSFMVDLCVFFFLNKLIYIFSFNKST